MTKPIMVIKIAIKLLHVIKKVFNIVYFICIYAKILTFALLYLHVFIARY